MPRITIIRNPPDDLGLLRSTIGGHAKVGYYLTFRGDPEEVVTMLEAVLDLAKVALPAGNYEDER